MTYTIWNVCRWGYNSLENMQAAWQRTRDAGRNNREINIIIHLFGYLNISQSTVFSPLSKKYKCCPLIEFERKVESHFLQQFLEHIIRNIVRTLWRKLLSTPWSTLHTEGNIRWWKILEGNFVYIQLMR